VRGGDEALKKAKRRLKRKKEKEGKKATGAGKQTLGTALALASDGVLLTLTSFGRSMIAPCS
jgi:hypothetical protein